MSQKSINDLTNFNFGKKSDFVITPYVKDITSRALAYMKAGYPVHLVGPAGTGKTIISLYIAHMLQKPTTIIFGNEDFETSDMVGLQYGFRKKLIVDDYIRSVHKRVEDYEQKWMDGRIVEACENGYTLIYDEFTRSRPEANNILLSVLEEKILELPISYKGENKLIKVHPEFNTIFTSNPEEYAGVFKSQDAMIDRFITIELEFPDLASEATIAKAKSGISRENADKLVRIVRAFRKMYKSNFFVSLRESIKLCKVVHSNHIHVDSRNDTFIQICMDILTSGMNVKKASVDKDQLKNDLYGIITAVLAKTSAKEENKDEQD